MYGCMAKENMNYKEFTDYVMENFIEVLGEYTDVTGVFLETYTAYKDNRGKLDALQVNFPNENGAPIIYLNDMFKSYQENLEENLPEIEVVREVIDQYAKNLVQRMQDIRKEMSMFNSSDTLDNIILDNLTKLRMRLIGYEKNKERLKDIPHRRFLDMAVTYQIYISQNSSARLTNRMIKEIGLTEEELYTIALKNLEDDVEVCKLSDCLPSELLELEREINMLVLTNKGKQYGAAAIFSKNTWEKAARMYNSNFYLLPSSIHEWLAIPDCSWYKDDGKEITVREYHDMVREVNDSEVDEEDRLTYSVYYYSKESGEISILKCGE